MRFFVRLAIGLFVMGLVVLIFAVVFGGKDLRRGVLQGDSPVGQILSPSTPQAAPPAQPPVTERTHPSEKPEEIPQSTPASGSSSP